MSCLVNRKSAATTRSTCCHPSGKRLLAAAFYEVLLLFGVYFAAALVFLSALSWNYPLSTEQTYIFRLYLWLVFGTYFVFFWVRGGQTLAMKTWGIRLVQRAASTPHTDEPPSSLPPIFSSPTVWQACQRYCLVWLLILPVGLCFWFRWLNKNKLFLHDHLLGLALIKTS